MTERPVSEVVADLRRWAVASRPDDLLMAEAAALLERLDAELTDCKQDRASFRQQLIDARAAHDLLPDCPTCGGTGEVLRVHCLGCGATWLNNGDCTCTCADGDENYERWDCDPVRPCPEKCDHGKVSPARLAALWRAVWDDGGDPEQGEAPDYYWGWRCAIQHLREIKPT